MESLAFFFESLELPVKTGILAAFKKTTLEKGDLFVKQGRVNSYLAFVENGIFQFFVNTEKGEVTTYMVKENNFLISIESFIGEIPAEENIRALTKADIWQIHKKDFERLKNEYESLARLYIEMLEHHIVCIHQERRNLIAMTPEQRYTKILQETPQLLQQIPLQYLASIIGITPRHLSRIRRNITPVHF